MDLLPLVTPFAAVDALTVFGLVIPVAFFVLMVAVVRGVGSSGRARTQESPGERELRETAFTGAPRATVQWPRNRRKPSLADVLRIADLYGYELVDREDAADTVVLRFVLAEQG